MYYGVPHACLVPIEVKKGHKKTLELQLEIVGTVI